MAVGSYMKGDPALCGLRNAFKHLIGTNTLPISLDPINCKGGSTNCAVNAARIRCLNCVITAEILNAGINYCGWPFT